MLPCRTKLLWLYLTVVSDILQTVNTWQNIEWEEEQRDKTTQCLRGSSRRVQPKMTVRFQKMLHNHIYRPQVNVHLWVYSQMRTHSHRMQCRGDSLCQSGQIKAIARFGEVLEEREPSAQPSEKKLKHLSHRNGFKALTRVCVRVRETHTASTLEYVLSVWRGIHCEGAEMIKMLARGNWSLKGCIVWTVCIYLPLCVSG